MKQECVCECVCVCVEATNGRRQAQSGIVFVPTPARPAAKVGIVCVSLVMLRGHALARGASKREGKVLENYKV